MGGRIRYTEEFKFTFFVTDDNTRSVNPWPLVNEFPDSIATLHSHGNNARLLDNHSSVGDARSAQRQNEVFGIEEHFVVGPNGCVSQLTAGIVTVPEPQNVTPAWTRELIENGALNRNIFRVAPSNLLSPIDDD